MKKRILWLGLSFLVVASLVLSSCGEAAVEQEEAKTPAKEEAKEEKEEEAKLDEYKVGADGYGMNAGVPELGLGLTVPKYGGSITLLEVLTESAGSPKPVGGLGTGSVDQFSLKVQEKAIGADIYTYGAFGDGSFLFKDDVGTPLRYAAGILAESWTITPESVTLNIRDGVYWTGESINPGVMEKRLYTAEDFHFVLMERLAPDSSSHGYFDGLGWITEPWDDNVYVSGDSVILNTDYYHSQWDSIIVGGSGEQMSPENWAAGGDDWENLVGTGPFIMSDFVQGSHVTVKRNPDYWRKAPILGKLYETPFLDEIVMPMILDESTAVAALRTGTIDMFVKLKAPHVASLDQTNPDLNSIVYLGNVGGVRFNLRNPPLDQLEVRRALHIGTDRLAINTMMMNPDTLHHRYPMGDAWPGFVAMEDLPESSQLLYDYDPEAAKQMLIDAGVTDLKIHAIGRTSGAPIAEMLMDQWALLGVELELEIIDSAAYSAIYYGPPPPFTDDMIVGGTVIHTPVFFAQRYFASDGPRNIGAYYSDYVDERLWDAAKEPDPEKLRIMMEEAFVEIIAGVSNIPFANTPQYHYWWPWLKNNFGEAWYYHRSADAHNWWLDEDLKESMGY